MKSTMSTVSLGSQRVVVCGGGIIGSSVAYFLAKKGVPCTVVERYKPACAASGRAGGFLARDWCDNYELGSLARASFDLHVELSKTFPNTDFRRLDTIAVSVTEQSSQKKNSVRAEIPAWVDGSVSGAYIMGTPDTTAQVHPYKLTHCFLDAAKEMVGSTVLTGTVEGLEFSADKAKVIGVKVSGDIIPADVVVVTMGPWSWQASKWLNIPPIHGQRAHSVILKPENPVTPTALFVEYKPKRGLARSPEFYPRPDGDVVVCGMGDSVPLPDDPSTIEPNLASCATLQEMAKSVSSHLGESTFVRNSACYLPVSSDGLPVIGKVPNMEGAYIGAGHSCWGILNAPGTGAALAELIVDGKCTLVDLKPFSPARFY